MKTRLLLFIFAFFFLISLAYAFDASQARYPVSELGSCASEQEWSSYGDNPDNIESCFNFAEKNGMISQQEAAEARKVMPFLKRGETPGKCKSQKECDAYCDDDSHLNECIDFAVKAG